MKGTVIEIQMKFIICFILRFPEYGKPETGVTAMQHVEMDINLEKYIASNRLKIKTSQRTTT